MKLLLFLIICLTAIKGLSGNLPKEKVNSVTGTISLKNNAIKQENDIYVRFTLICKSCVKPVYIWDSKFSNGYRSWSFHVKTPDGKDILLQRSIQNSWDKNAPHVVSINKNNPYELRGWGIAHGLWEGEKYYFSLKKLGLQFSTTGKYEIYGVFAQPGGTSKFNKKDVVLWKGKVISNKEIFIIH